MEQVQKNIEYISYSAEDYRQILLREMALLDYQSDLNAYKREGIQETLDAMRLVGVSEEQIKEAMQKLSENK